MKTLALALLVCFLTPALYASDFLPKDGNGLLDACSALVDSDDNPSSISSLSGERFTERMGQFNWCAGYLAATQDVLVQSYANLIFMGMAGVSLAGPDKEKQSVFDAIRGPCVPDNATLLQLARVLVKWLREHPERLHEPKSTLTMAAFKDSFPCQPTIPKPAAKQTTVKP
jgi:hypothetical protein